MALNVKRMKKLFIGIFIGIFVSSLVFVAIAIELLGSIKEKEELGRNMGVIDGGYQVIHFLNKNFPPEDKIEEKVIDSFQFKDRSICVVEQNEVLTIKTQ